jgi:AraC-like DNA-binding protein
MKHATQFTLHPGWKLIVFDLGVAPGDLLALAELPADLFGRKDAVLTPAQYFRFFLGLEKLVGDAELPVRLGGGISVEAFDAALFACLCSPNLNVAFTRLAAYKRLCGPLSLDVCIGENYTEVIIECYGHDGPLPCSLCATELAFFTQLARLATRHAISPIEAELTVLPSQVGPCENFLGCRLEQGSSNRIRFSTEDAKRPFLTENLAMWRFFEPELRARLSKLDAEASTRERVRSALLDMLPSGQSSIDDISSRLAMSKRSLQRHLADEAISYQDVLNGTRQELASYYLAHSTISPGEIAFLIGFQDTNSFLRAFKAWTGVTPGEYRNLHAHPA